MESRPNYILPRIKGLCGQEPESAAAPELILGSTIHRSPWSGHLLPPDPMFRAGMDGPQDGLSALYRKCAKLLPHNLRAQTMPDFHASRHPTALHKEAGCLCRTPALPQAPPCIRADGRLPPLPIRQWLSAEQDPNENAHNSEEAGLLKRPEASAAVWQSPRLL